MKTITLYRATCTRVERVGEGHYRVVLDAPSCEPPRVMMNFRLLDGAQLPDMIRVGGTYFVLLSDTNPEVVLRPAAVAPVG